ncbi:hypothetical protein ACFVT8_01425 [Lysinibacillus sp. NPDC058147]|uniref:hypothetical protein n=1 Tax=unclassified Lysinibacillus TaxID=2636778 RepID=UPI0036D8257E
MFITKKGESINGKSTEGVIVEADEFLMGNIIGEENYINENMIASEMMELIKTNITEREQSELKYVLYPKEYNSTHLSKELKISRPAAHQRITKLKTKLQRLLIENNFTYDLSAK